jgi:hypothetical protein
MCQCDKNVATKIKLYIVYVFYISHVVPLPYLKIKYRQAIFAAKKLSQRKNLPVLACETSL